MIDVLHKIQKDLKAPKGQKNEFGGYKYRSCEDILEAVKKLLPEGVSVVLSDDLVLVGDRYYIKATASLISEKNKLEVSAFARESLDKKGMDSAQITGAASSYARKYALNGLFCIDDTKDADATNDGKEEPKETAREDKVFQRDFLYALANTKTDEEIRSLVDEMGDRFDALPPYINDTITDAIGMKRKQFKNGVQSVPVKFGFLDVQEAGEFGVTAKNKIDTEKNLDDLREWMIDNDHKLKALDTMLKAAKYQTAEGTPYQRLTKAYNKRMPQAAE